MLLDIHQGFPTCGPWAKSVLPSLWKWPSTSQNIGMKYIWKIAKIDIFTGET